MGYELPKLNLGGLLSQLCEAEDQLARLDERVARSAVGQGFAERLHFVDACSAMWIAGELVQLEDLVLHDAYMDARAPSHELTQANAILRLRRRLARLDGSHDITTTAGLARLRGRPVPDGQERGGVAAADPLERRFDEFDDAGAMDKDRLVAGEEGFTSKPSATSPQPTGPDIAAARFGWMIRDEDSQEAEQLADWLTLHDGLRQFPPALAAAVALDAWQQRGPLPREPYVGVLVVAAELSRRGKTRSHLLGLHHAIRNVPREGRRSPDVQLRIERLLHVMIMAGRLGLSELARLSQARELLLRRHPGRRTNSRLDELIELVLARPLITTTLVAKELKVSQRGALSLIEQLSLREITGRGRYRAWAVV